MKRNNRPNPLTHLSRIRITFDWFQVSSTEVEQESEKIADEFLEEDSSESNVDAFLEKFLVILRYS